MKILLIAGHGNGDVGAVGNGYKEADLTREVVKLLKTPLSKYATVDIADTSVNWFSSRSKLNAKGYDYVLEIHFNAIKAETVADGATKGVEIYVTEAEKSVTVEQKIVDNISTLGYKNRGVKRKNYSVIKHVKNQGVSSALLEVCFIDDIDDMRIYTTKKNDIINAIVKGIVDGFGLAKTEIKTTVDNTVDSLADACNLLASKGIIDSPEYWAKGEGYSDSNTVLLIKKFAKYVKGA